MNDRLLHRSVTWALRILTALIAAVTLVCFVQSYRQLYGWAWRHQIPLPWAYTWPVMLDAFVAIGEIGLFVSLVKGWPVRTRLLAWALVAAGLAGSLAANVGHLAQADWMTRLTAAVAPAGAAVGLAAGLIVLKWLAAEHRSPVMARPIVARDKEEAAMVAFAKSVEGTNPLTERQLHIRYGITRTVAKQIVTAGTQDSPAGATPDSRPAPAGATLNGSAHG